MLPELLDQIQFDQDIGSVTADGAYDTRKCHDAIAARNALAVIPPRRKAKPWTPASAGAMARNEAVNASRYLGRALWRQLSGYQRRSRVEQPSRDIAAQYPAGQRMHFVKLLGHSLMARDFERQIAEIQVRTAVLNRYAAWLGGSGSSLPASNVFPFERAQPVHIYPYKSAFRPHEMPPRYAQRSLPASTC